MSTCPEMKIFVTRQDAIGIHAHITVQPVCANSKSIVQAIQTQVQWNPVNLFQFCTWINNFKLSQPESAFLCPHSWVNSILLTSSYSSSCFPLLPFLPIWPNHTHSMNYKRCQASIKLSQVCSPENNQMPYPMNSLHSKGNLVYPFNTHNTRPWDDHLPTMQIWCILQ